MSPAKMPLILLALLSAILMTHPLKRASAEQPTPPTYKPEIKVFIPFAPNYDTSLKLVKPGQGLTFIQEQETSGKIDSSSPDTNLGYCEDRDLTSSTSSSSDGPHSHSESDPSCK